MPFVLALLLLSPAYLFYFVSRLPAGVWRVLASLPIIAAQISAPRALCDRNVSVVATGACAFVITWLGSFKVLGLCCNRGPLSQSGLKLLPFTLLLTLPIVPVQLSRQPNSTGGKSSGKVSRSIRADSSTAVLDGTASSATLSMPAAACSAEIKRLEQPKLVPSAPAWRWQACAFKLALLSALCVFRPELQGPLLLRDSAYMLYIFLITDVGMEVTAMAVSSLSGLQLAQAFDHPYLSATTGEFWGRRYNQVVGRLLKELVFAPIKEGRLVRGPEKLAAGGFVELALRQAVGVVAVFGVSGIMHELVLWFMSGVAPKKHMSFFLLQGVIVIIEAIAIAWAQRTWALPWGAHSKLGLRVAGAALTLLQILVLSRMYFFPAFTDAGLDQKGLQEFANGIKGLGTLLAWQ